MTITHTNGYSRIRGYCDREFFYRPFSLLLRIWSIHFSLVKDWDGIKGGGGGYRYTSQLGE